MNAHSALAQRAQSLEAVFRDIACTRMAGVPVLHAALRVEAVDFELLATGDEHGALGVLVTPWFMNLVWFPLGRRDTPAKVGDSRVREVGGERFEFIAAHEERFGSFEACSLFSPMFQFADHAAARATAAAVLASLRARPARPVRPVRPLEKPPARRSFLFGRSAVGEHSA